MYYPITEVIGGPLLGILEQEHSRALSARDKKTGCVIYLVGCEGRGHRKRKLWLNQRLRGNNHC